MTKPSPVSIPKSTLRAQLYEAEAIKREMAGLLRQLEAKTTGRPVAKPGSWRHNPTGWLQRHGLSRKGQPN